MCLGRRLVKMDPTLTKSTEFMTTLYYSLHFLSVSLDVDDIFYFIYLMHLMYIIESSPQKYQENEIPHISFHRLFQHCIGS